MRTAAARPAPASRLAFPATVPASRPAAPWPAPASRPAVPATVPVPHSPQPVSHSPGDSWRDRARAEPVADAPEECLTGETRHTAGIHGHWRLGGWLAFLRCIADGRTKMRPVPPSLGGQADGDGGRRRPPRRRSGRVARRAPAGATLHRRRRPPRSTLARSSPATTRKPKRTSGWVTRPAPAPSSRIAVSADSADAINTASSSPGGRRRYSSTGLPSGSTSRSPDAASCWPAGAGGRAS